MPPDQSSLVWSGASPPWDRATLWMAGFTLLVLFVVYRRLRRQFRAQPLHPVRLGLRIALLVVTGLALLPFAARSFTSLGVGVLGLGAGIALGAIAAARTRFTMRGESLHYVPHTATGVLISTLLLVRLGVRFSKVYSGGPWPGAAGPDSSGAGMVPGPRDLGPLTTGLFYLLIGYYVFYYSQLLWKSKHLKPTDFDGSRMPT